MSVKRIAIREEEHSKLSASSAKRWMNCAGSVHLPHKEDKRETTGAAWDGTVMHAAAAMVLKGEISSVDDCYRLPLAYEGVLTGRTFTKRMVSLTKPYVAFCEERKDAEWWIEVKASLAEDGLPDVWGTVDFVAWDAEKSLLEIVDLKTGKWPVSPEYNEQLSIYGLATMFELWKAEGVKPEKIDLIIVQPAVWKNQPDTTWRAKREVLKGFYKDLSIAVNRIDQAEKDPEQYLVEGNWCRFCPAKHVCPLKQIDLKVSRRKEKNDMSK